MSSQCRLTQPRRALVVIAVVALLATTSTSLAVLGHITPEDLGLSVLVIALVGLAWFALISPHRDDSSWGVLLGYLLLCIAAAGFSTPGWFPSYAAPAAIIGFTALTALELVLWVFGATTNGDLANE
ncbi:hypothetical protein [Halomarina oriensis]|uniref:Uncharacterized protein n=1 Tax=Halomarina oriensis TaxID=671145 RepID=A0A6B0GIX9_9EURY|nr:hypothetical protein [Halomarina oriensis]MWG34836.1 hypothetical protein [Halomarina oriensis]